MIWISKGMNEEKRAIISLCSHAGREDKEISPFTAKGWSRVRDALDKAVLSEADLLRVNSSELFRILGKRDAQRVESLRKSAKLESFLQKLDDQGVQIYCEADEIFPERLRLRLGEECPPVLYALGNTDILLEREKKLAVVGKRNCVSLSLERSAWVGKNAAKKGICVVSGAAQNVDLTAQKTAIAQHGMSIAVLPYGLLNKRTLQLKDSFSGRYLLLSAAEPDSGFSAQQALYRNKLIYALSDVAIVIEAGDGEGGTWKGAKEALEKRYCELYAVEEPRLNGNMRLIQLGAKGYHFDQEVFPFG